jgi:hypothetical protein
MHLLICAYYCNESISISLQLFVPEVLVISEQHHHTRARSKLEMVQAGRQRCCYKRREAVYLAWQE